MGGMQFCGQSIFVYFVLLTSVQATHTSILRSPNALVTGSSKHPDPLLLLSHATDGTTGTNPVTCGCCAATKSELNPWMKIDLGRLYRVSTVNVKGGTNSTGPFAGIAIFLHTQPTAWQQNNSKVVSIPVVNGTDPFFNKTFEHPVIARYATLQLTGKYHLLICDVKIYSRDCHAGTFGQDCSSICHCYNNVTCDHVTGRCPDDRCDLGWHGINCSKQCDAGRFGSNCLETCGNCLNNDPCDMEDGNCTSCSIGYIGQQCKEECQSGSYGQNCSMTCGHCMEHCDIISGLCLAACHPGYRGKFCKKKYNILTDASVNISMSSVYRSLDATKAIDGVYMNDLQECFCCSETENDGHSWWKAEFGTPKFINQIDIHGRFDEHTVRHLAGFQIFTKKPGEYSEEVVFVHNASSQDKMVSVQLDDAAVTSVRIQRAGILAICEVEIYHSDIKCAKNTYGRSCSPCGYCKNRTCELVTGHCPGGCDDNFEGDMCLTLKTQQSMTPAVVAGVVGISIPIVIALVVIGIIWLLRFIERKRDYIALKLSWKNGSESAYVEGLGDSDY